MRARLQGFLTGSGFGAVPRHSWSVFHPTVRGQALHPIDKLAIAKSARVRFVQAHVHPSRLQKVLMGWGVALAVGSAIYQFVTNLHTVPITGRTQVVALSQEEEIELGTTAAIDGIADARLITSGPRLRMCVDIVSRLVTVSEHLFPREYEWAIWLVDSPSVVNACCYPGGKIVIYTGILDLVDVAVEKGLVSNKHDALAVILAHEIAHALARHVAERMSYLPILYLQTILGYESPLLQYGFQFAMNLPFSRVQEMEADHIGIMLMAQACYDPATAPKFWKAFAQVLQGDDEEEELDLDFFSTHPSHKKRERKLETLVPAALELQQQASWCFQVKERVQQLVEGAPAENAFLQRIRRFMKEQQQQQPQQEHAENRGEPRRRYTMGTVHELENQEIYKGLRTEQERKRVASAGDAGTQ